MNPLRRPAVAARREGTPSGEIDGSTPVEADPGIGDGGGSPYGPDGRLRPGGASAGGQGAPAHGVQAPRGRGVDAPWPSSPTAGPTAIPTGGVGVPASGVGTGGLGMAAMAGAFLDWWNSAAAMLGPEWLASVLTATTALASTSTGNHAMAREALREEPSAVEGAPARRRGGAVAMNLGRGRRFVLPLHASTSTLLIRCKHTSLATNFLDNIGMPCDAFECEHGMMH